MYDTAIYDATIECSWVVSIYKEGKKQNNFLSARISLCKK